MTLNLSYVILASSLVCGVAWAGTATITDAGARNVGSSAAYVATCEQERLVPSGTLAVFLAELQERLTPEHWGKVKRQYQISLHDKRQYSIAKDRWFAFEVNSANCADLAKALPVVMSAVRRNSR